MIRTVDGEFVAECSECGAEEPGGTVDDFRKFVEQLKDDGWRIRKEEDEWLHICPDCQEWAHAAHVRPVPRPPP